MEDKEEEEDGDEGISAEALNEEDRSRNNDDGAGCQESDGRGEGSRRPHLPYPLPQRYIFRRKTALRNVSLQSLLPQTSLQRSGWDEGGGADIETRDGAHGGVGKS